MTSITALRAQYVSLREKWRTLEQQIKAEQDVKKRSRLENKQRQVGAQRNAALLRIVEEENRDG